MTDFWQRITDSGYLREMRGRQDLAWLHARVSTTLEQLVMAQPKIRDFYERELEKVQKGDTSVSSAVSRIEKEFRKTLLS
jgi:putative protein kinase ArgK-like GTPase of G3E family